MGIYIKDIDMPSGCISCPFKSHGTVDEFKYYCDMTGAFVGSWESKKLNQRHKDCPLVEEKTGKWIDSIEHDGWFCSKCGYSITSRYGKYNYCPNCGSRMGE